MLDDIVWTVIGILVGWFITICFMFNTIDKDCVNLGHFSTNKYTYKCERITK